MPASPNKESHQQRHAKLVGEIVLAVNALGVGRFWPQETGAFFRYGFRVDYGIVGGGDISGIVRGGLRVEIEVKGGRKGQSKEQRNFQNMVQAWGGIYILARSVDDAVRSLQAFSK